jgi:RNA polymerase sigma-70 factor (ECF subfamily)
MGSPDHMAAGQITTLLEKWSSGDEQALSDLIPLVYMRLHEVAGRLLVGERPGHILQPTALVNEAYMRLAGLSEMEWQNRIHFFENPEYIVLFDQVLTNLSKEHPRKGRLVELHSFGGLTLAEAAEFLQVSENTAQRDWKFAKAWMTRELGRHSEYQSRED